MAEWVPINNAPTAGAVMAEMQRRIDANVVQVPLGMIQQPVNYQILGSSTVLAESQRNQ